MEIEEGIKKLSLQPERAVVEAKVEEMIEEGAEEPEEKIADEATALVLPQKLRPRFYDAPRWVKLVCRYLLRASGATEGDRTDFLVMATNKMLRLAKQEENQSTELQKKKREITDLRLKLQQKEHQTQNSSLFPEGGSPQEEKMEEGSPQGEEEEGDENQNLLDQMLSRDLNSQESQEVLSLMEQMKSETNQGMISTMGQLLENPIDTLDLFHLTLENKYVTDNAELEKYPEMDE